MFILLRDWSESRVFVWEIGDRPEQISEVRIPNLINRTVFFLNGHVVIFDKDEKLFLRAKYQEDDILAKLNELGVNEEIKGISIDQFLRISYLLIDYKVFDQCITRSLLQISLSFIQPGFKIINCEEWLQQGHYLVYKFAQPERNSQSKDTIHIGLLLGSKYIHLTDININQAQPIAWSISKVKAKNFGNLIWIEYPNSEKLGVTLTF